MIVPAALAAGAAVLAQLQLFSTRSAALTASRCRRCTAPRPGSPRPAWWSPRANKKPIGAMPAIYSDGNRQLAVFASGGYVDPLLATWSAGTQALVAIALDVDGPYPITETSSKLAIKQDLAAGRRALGQVLVVGTSCGFRRTAPTSTRPRSAWPATPAG